MTVIVLPHAVSQITSNRHRTLHRQAITHPEQKEPDRDIDGTIMIPLCIVVDKLYSGSVNSITKSQNALARLETAHTKYCYLQQAKNCESHVAIFTYVALRLYKLLDRHMCLAWNQIDEF